MKGSVLLAAFAIWFPAVALATAEPSMAQAMTGAAQATAPQPTAPQPTAPQAKRPLEPAEPRATSAAPTQKSQGVPISLASALAGAANLVARGDIADAASLLRIAQRFSKPAWPSDLSDDTRYALALADAAGQPGAAYPGRLDLIGATLEALAKGEAFPEGAWSLPANEMRMLCDLVALQAHFDGTKLSRSLGAGPAPALAAGADPGLRRCLAEDVLPLIAATVQAAEQFVPSISASDTRSLAAVARRFALEGRYDQAALLCASLADPALRDAVSRAVVSVRQLSALKLRDQQLESAFLQNWRNNEGEAAIVFGHLFLERATKDTLTNRRPLILAALDRTPAPLLERSARLAVLERLDLPQAMTLRPGEDRPPVREFLGLLAFGPAGDALERWQAELARLKIPPRERAAAAYIMFMRLGEAGTGKAAQRQKLLVDMLEAARKEPGPDPVLLRYAGMALADAARR